MKREGERPSATDASQCTWACRSHATTLACLLSAALSSLHRNHALTHSLARSTTPTMADPAPAAPIPGTDPSPAPAPAPPASASAPPAPIPRLLDPAHSRPPPSLTRVKTVNPRHFFSARNGPELLTAWLGAIGGASPLFLTPGIAWSWQR